ncbi:helix-turn-helix domain-containing protein [Methylobacterium pseudosasicola]|uniref:AraC-type DNA-binding protein n=1 Tax=Methylobacterium pseudosasicola TaxID=582667 RepID=A0A1I4J761_9HYPH|nr:helix-turn-helix domain-containing protein [Methylobacterium pseudosasicola]SFL62425.1 AraC-type DNA-binding protein [Methylobacterium pseudosasicola]
MNAKKTVPIFFGTTDSVEPKQAFDYWRSTVVTGTDLSQLDSAKPFSASRLVASSSHGAIFHTVSSPYSLERRPLHLRQDGRDEVGIMLILHGSGYLEQVNNGSLLGPGDISFQTWGRPGAAGALTEFEEIRLTVPRATFLAQVGNVDDFAARKFAAGPLNQLFAAYMRTFAESVAQMSDSETGIAVEGALHLLRGVINGRNAQADGELSVNALRSLALARIEHRLHDPEFGPDTLAADLRVSRSRLYAAFAGGEGIAATIREARLNRAHDRIVMMRKAGARIASIMASCGFTDPAAFSRAFRQRFGLSPRDLIAQGCD